MKYAYKVSSDLALSKKLRMSSISISSWRNRGKVPESRIIQTSIDTGTSLEWLMNGNNEASLLSVKPEDIISIREKVEKLISESLKIEGGIPSLKSNLEDMLLKIVLLNSTKLNTHEFK